MKRQRTYLCKSSDQENCLGTLQVIFPISNYIETYFLCFISVISFRSIPYERRLQYFRVFFNSFLLTCRTESLRLSSIHDLTSRHHKNNPYSVLSRKVCSVNVTSAGFVRQ
jgi:hypothetical protein